MIDETDLKILTILQQKTTIVTERRFKPVKLDSQELFDFPFIVMTGEGDFRLLQTERDNLAKYLQGGGFLLDIVKVSFDVRFDPEVVLAPIQFLG